MAFEKRWASIPPQLLTSDGLSNGSIEVADASLFRVKQLVLLKSDTQTTRILQVKAITDFNTIWLGNQDTPIDSFSDLSSFLVSDNSSLEATKQPRPKISKEDFNRAVYEEEPVVADRVIPVDQIGDFYTDDNPFPVKIPSGEFEIGIELPNSEGLSVLNIPNNTTEVSFTFPNNTRFYQIKVRDSKDLLKMGLTAGAIDLGSYWTLELGNVYSPEQQNDFEDGYTLYFKSKHKSNVDLEIRYWYSV